MIVSTFVVGAVVVTIQITAEKVAMERIVGVMILEVFLSVVGVMIVAPMMLMFNNKDVMHDCLSLFC